MLKTVGFFYDLVLMTEKLTLNEYKDGWFIQCRLRNGPEMKMICDYAADKSEEHIWEVHTLNHGNAPVKYLKEEEAIAYCNELISQ